jgi:hypothetical protein
MPVRPLLGETDHPLGEIAHVDELHVALRPSRNEHVAARRDAVGPVGEAIRRIVGPDDEPGTHDQRAARQRAIRFLFACDLESTVQRPEPLDVRGILAIERLTLAALVVGQRERRAVLGDPDRLERRACRHARYERVMVHRAGEGTSGRGDVAREEARGVDHRVPAPPGKSVEAAAPVAGDVVDARAQVRRKIVDARRMPAAMEQRDVVAALERRACHMAAEEYRAPEHEQLHRDSSRLRFTAAALPNQLCISLRSTVWRIPPLR